MVTIATVRLQYVVVDARTRRVEAAAAERHAVRVELPIFLHFPNDRPPELTQCTCINIIQYIYFADRSCVITGLLPIVVRLRRLFVATQQLLLANRSRSSSECFLLLNRTAINLCLRYSSKINR